MACRILAFPNEEHAAVSLPVLRGALALAKATHGGSAGAQATEKPLGPALVYARPRTQVSHDDMTQAEHLNALLNREISERVQREAAERQAGRGIALVGGRRTATLPMLATAVRFRERLLDALFFIDRRR